MRRWTRALRSASSVVVCLSLATGARAQGAASTDLAYATAIHDAPVLAPDIATTRAQSGIAAAGVGIARMYVNPVASIGTSTDGARFAGSITVPLPITRRGSAIRAAETAAASASAEVSVAALDARRAVGDAWCDLWLAEKTLQVATETAARAARVAESASVRFRTGTAARLDVARAEAERARLDAEAAARAELVAGAAAVLAYWLGRDPSVPTRTSGDLPVAPLPPLPTLLAKLDAHPIIERASARARDATARVDLERSMIWPAVGLQVGGAIADRSAPTNNLSVGVVFDVPVFNWNRAAVTLAERGVVRVAAETSAAAARLRADLVTAYAASRAAALRADAAQNRVLPASQTAADLTRDAYETGAVDLSAVLVAESALATAKQTAYDAIALRGRSLAALERAAGGSLSDGSR